MPCFTLIPPRGDHPIGGHAWVPIDDENCWAWSTNHHATRPLKPEEHAGARGRQRHPRRRYIPGTFTAGGEQGQRLPDGPRGAEGRPQLLAASRASRCRTPRCRKAWVRSRTARARTWCPPTRASSWRAGGCSRAAQGLAKGVQPPGVDPRHQRVRSVSIILPKDVAFSEAAEDALMPEPGSRTRYSVNSGSEPDIFYVRENEFGL